MRDDDRYRDDLDRERLLYYNGQYYRIKEAYYSGGPYSVPHMLWDPYGPWRFARPIPHDLDYWTDLDYRYQNTVYAKLKEITTHFHHSAITPNIDLLTAPLGASVNVKYTPIITIAFGDSSLNYSVEIDKDKVYRIDYLSNAVLTSIVGRVKVANITSGTDYRGNKMDYVILAIDCSTDFGSDVRTIDSRDIRYIKCLNDIQESLEINRSYIGTVEPDGTHGGFVNFWYNPSTNEYKVRQEDGSWKVISEKPTEKPDSGKYYRFNYDTMSWDMVDIPEIGDSIKNRIYVFDRDQGIWIIQPKEEKPLAPIIPALTKDQLPENVKFMPSKPDTVARYGKECYFNHVANEWKERERYSGNKPIFMTGTLYDEGTEVAIFNHEEEVWITATTPKLDFEAYENFSKIAYYKDGDFVIEDPDYNYYTAKYDSHLYSIILNTDNNQTYITPRVYGYKDNHWILEDTNQFMSIDDDYKPMEGYCWKFSYYFNRWIQYPIHRDTDVNDAGIGGRVPALNYANKINKVLPIYLKDLNDDTPTVLIGDYITWHNLGNNSIYIG